MKNKIVALHSFGGEYKIQNVCSNYMCREFVREWFGVKTKRAYAVISTERLTDTSIRIVKTDTFEVYVSRAQAKILHSWGLVNHARDTEIPAYRPMICDIDHHTKRCYVSVFKTRKEAESYS